MNIYMKHLLPATIIVFALSSNIGFAGEGFSLDQESDRINYSLGYQIGLDLKRQGMALDEPSMEQGLRDALAKTDPLLTDQEMKTLLGQLKRRIVSAQREEAIKRAEKKKKEAEDKRKRALAFLEENADKPGVKTLPSRLQYKVIRPGTGEKPGLHDTVTVHYRGTLIDGHEFDSSYRRNQPAAFRVDGVIAGWTEALQLMDEGAQWELYIPPDLAFGSRGPVADETLVYQVELIAVGDKLAAADRKEAQ